jgi:uncharacterized protein (DUF4415 family)
MSEFRMVRAVKIGSEVYERLPDGRLKPLEDRSDDAALDATSEEEINRQAEEDGTLLSDEEWAKVKFIDPFKKPITIRLDGDVLEWFKAQGGRGYQTRINAVLRQYMNVHNKAS